MVIAATRMYRSLSNYSDSYRYASKQVGCPQFSTIVHSPSGMTTRTRDIELRDPFMLPIEVTVHKERHEESSTLR